MEDNCKINQESNLCYLIKKLTVTSTISGK